MHRDPFSKDSFTEESSIVMKTIAEPSTNNFSRDPVSSYLHHAGYPGLFSISTTIKNINYHSKTDTVIATQSRTLQIL